MKIAIIGTRGIPNYYGGFEQCAEYLALGLKKNGHSVTVYNSHSHPFKETQWNGVDLVHCYDPEDKIGTAGQFIYDLNCILDLRKRKFDVVLQLGYTSSSVWGWLLPKNTAVTTNMDGLEWKRTKYSAKVRKFLMWAEKLGVKYSDHLISDSIGIQDYLSEKYGKSSTFIPYGAYVFEDPKESVLKEYGLNPYNYDLLIARLEPENSIEIILDGVAAANTDRTFLVIGKHETHYGEYLKDKYRGNTSIKFLGGIYDIKKLDSMRYFSNLYFHGHTVGGTNPSLLEAIASESLICANQNAFNSYILGEDALYFSSASDVAGYLKTVRKADISSQLMLKNNIEKIRKTYTWERIVEQYESHLESIAGKITRK
jgi:glycosyltransferase involved in cell wall biosynthesis